MGVNSNDVSVIRVKPSDALGNITGIKACRIHGYLVIDYETCEFEDFWFYTNKNIGYYYDRGHSNWYSPGYAGAELYGSGEYVLIKATRSNATFSKEKNIDIEIIYNVKS